MPEIRDPAIKLFGKMIALQSAESGGGGGGEEEDKGHLTSKDTEQESPDSKESSSEYDKGNHSSSDDQEKAPENNSKPEEEEDDDDEEEEEEDEEHHDSSNPMLKKPDKILPCPRCNSLETKFCYYNNYNVNQPRHFCKHCQRYWTAGGTMRNVPVGAGRRKNKNSIASALYHHLTVSDAGLQAMIPEQIHRPPPLRSNGTVLSFGSDPPLASALNLPQKKSISCHRNGVHPAEEHMEEQWSLSPVTQDCQSFSSTNVPCQFPWTPPPPPPPPALCAPSYPMPFYPAAAAYWGYNPWVLPWLSSLPSPSPLSGWSVPGPDHCPALGKHSREEDAVPEDSSSSERRRLWIPKTLRIHDPEEAAKSSIWASMGFKSDDDGQGFFETFQTKGELRRTHLGEASSQALHANPAALSRSINFLESS